MAEEVIRYGAGGLPYKGNVGQQGTQEAPTPEPVEEDQEPKVSVEIIEDSPLSDEQVVAKVTGNEK
jgi:hypothetical protein